MKTILIKQFLKNTFFKMAFLVASLIIAGANVCSASVTYYWDGTTAAVNSGSDSRISTIGDVTRMHASGALTGSNSPASPGSGDSYFVAAAVSGALSISDSTYFQIVLTPASSYAIQLDTISLYSRSTSTGPTLISIYSSINNYASAIGSASVTTGGSWSSLLSFNGNSLTGLVDSDVIFRIYASGGTSASGGNWRVDDISLSVTPIPEPAAWGAASAVGLLAISGFTTWRERKPKAAISAPGAT